MTYRVLLQRAVSEEAAIEVEAEHPEEAEDYARAMAEDGMVAWTVVHDDTEATVERKQ